MRLKIGDFEIEIDGIYLFVIIGTIGLVLLGIFGVE